jgi:hypothetical protein
MVVCTVKKILPSNTKFFMCVIVVMKFLFHLFHVVTVVSNVKSNLWNFEHCQQLCVCVCVCTCMWLCV